MGGKVVSILENRTGLEYIHQMVSVDDFVLLPQIFRRSRQRIANHNFNK